MDLPTEDEDWDLPPDSIGSESPFSQTAYLQAQATQLLGRVTSIISNPPSNNEERGQEDSSLKTSLVQFAISVTNCSKDVWGANCGTLGLTYRYVLCHFNIIADSPGSRTIDPCHHVAHISTTAQSTISTSLPINQK